MKLSKKQSKILIFSLIFLLTISITVVIKIMKSTPTSTSENTDINISPLIQGKIPPSEKVTISSNNPICDSVNKTAFEVFPKLDPAEENVIFSPASLLTALSMLQGAGSQESKDEILKKLFSKDADSLTTENIDSYYQEYIDYILTLNYYSTVKLKNSLWINSCNSTQIDSLYLNNCSEYYYSDVYSHNFFESPKEGLSAMNSWVFHATDGKVKVIMDNIPDNFVLSIINTLYLHMDWKNSFNPKYTKSERFYPSSKRSRSVKTMYIEETLPYYECDKYQMIKKYYTGKDLNMTIVLPGENYSLEDVIKDLDLSWWNNSKDNFSKTPVHLYLPKFKFEYSKEFNEILHSLGIENIFTDSNTPLPKISEDAYVSLIKQKCFIAIDEKGTEAAAATAVSTKNKSDHMEPPSFKLFKADHPFVYIISDTETNSILFIGTVNSI